ncbi:hypothetical protein OIU77_008115 [Salix suchowensis]|uniref:Leucine-rich repeat-containing protein 51 n=1 Tax=Salix suchowensis TaxID=1278906 RepID=A0ABQ9AID8_9ROSI|nr:hypothetical protein OIU77_008115 [Salix suchowensis]
MGNGINAIQTASSSIVQGFDSLRLLNLEENCIAEWNEILKFSQLRSLEELHLNKNNLNHIFYPDHDTINKMVGGDESHDQSCIPFQNLRCLRLGGNDIEDLASVDSLNSFPKLIPLLSYFLCMLKDIRLSENPIADPGRGGIPRFVLVARLARVEILNGSEVSTRERKESIFSCAPMCYFPSIRIVWCFYIANSLTILASSCMLMISILSFSSLTKMKSNSIPGLLS